MADIADPSPPDAQRVDLGTILSDPAPFFRQVGEGRSFLVTFHDSVVAELRPPPTMESTVRTPGTLRGRIITADQLGELPEDILDLMERGAE